jgi:hypothetical protein
MLDGLTEIVKEMGGGGGGGVELDPPPQPFSNRIAIKVKILGTGGGVRTIVLTKCCDIRVL